MYYERLHTVLLAAPGLVLAVWTIRLFFAAGKGTLAPWDPPKKLVVLGPHRHVRIPMITGVLLMLAAESVLFGSWPLAAWMVAFLVIHAIYLLRFEEPSLERRLGVDYRRYKRSAPRWSSSGPARSSRSTTWPAVARSACGPANGPTTRSRMQNSMMSSRHGRNRRPPTGR